MKPAAGRGNYYSGVALDRAEHLRRDSAWLAARLADPETVFVPVWRDRNLVATGGEARAVWLRGGGAPAAARRAAEIMFLGRDRRAAFFALDLSDLEEDAAARAVGGRGAFQDLRSVGPVIERGEGAILAYARGLAYWHRRHRFCGLCGGPTRSNQAGHARRCANEGCGTEHFPRTDPAVIMLVHDGERCVLGRQRAWPEGMHSTLAGFVEPGESLEEAVAREVYEEVGLEVTDVAYQSSQPWPFPSSIMLGFQARARHAPLRVDGAELAAAGWFTQAELQASPENTEFRLPRRDSIAWRLIEDWLAAGPAGDTRT